MRTGQPRVSYSKLISEVDEDLQSCRGLCVEFKGRPLPSFALMQREQGALNMQNLSFHNYQKYRHKEYCPGIWAVNMDKSFDGMASIEINWSGKIVTYSDPSKRLFIIKDQYYISAWHTRTLLTVNSKTETIFIASYMKNIHYCFLYNNQINEGALIDQSAVGYCAGKPMEKSRVYWNII